MVDWLIDWLISRVLHCSCFVFIVDEVDHLKLYVGGLKAQTSLDDIRAFFPAAIEVLKPGRNKRKAREGAAYVQFFKQCMN